MSIQNHTYNQAEDPVPSCVNEGEIEDLFIGKPKSLKYTYRPDIRDPTNAEQQRNADCLCSLDELITARNQKLAALRTFKKGLMQQLFPAPEGDEA